MRLLYFASALQCRKILRDEGAELQYPSGCCNEVGKKEVDEECKTPHNLSSLLLTNKTLCRQVARCNTEQVL
jgi:hypothetical protein